MNSGRESRNTGSKSRQTSHNNESVRSALEHYQAGNLPEAEHFLKEALRNRPDDAEISYLLGIVYAQSGNYDLAIQLITKSIRADATKAHVYLALGTAYMANGNFAQAEQSLKKGLEIDPDLIEAYYRLGDIYNRSERLDDAVACYFKAQKLAPDNAGTCLVVGTLLYRKGRIDEAISFYRKALDIDRGLFDAYVYLGNAYQEKKEFGKATDCYTEALRIRPGDATVLINLGITFHNTGQFEDAITYFRKALTLNPNLTVAYEHMGLTLIQQGNLTEAGECFRSAIRIRPDSVQSFIKLAHIFEKQGRLNEAEDCNRRAMSIQPDNPIPYEGLLMSMIYNPVHSAQEIFAEHVRFADRFAEPLASSIVCHVRPRTCDRKLRIGYVSPDFRKHPVASFVEPVLLCHDRRHFEIFCYSDVGCPDEVTERIKNLADIWKDLRGISDEKAADLIRKDGVDLLIDLAGHTLDNRLLMFARKPAPVESSWIGYPCTTGLSTIDYKIVDNYTDPPGMTEQFYTEKLSRMPDCFLCYLPDCDSPGVGHLPAIAEGRVTFGSFNNFAKISPEVTSAWIAIMASVPDSRLVLKADGLSDATLRRSLLDRFEEGGIARERLELLSWVPSRKEHLELYHKIDIALDTFPYNGTTTTCEAVWMGLPVITLKGNTHASRVGISLLTNIGLPELVAGTRDEYVEIAVRLAADIRGLKSLRERLRDMIKQSPLMDAKLFTLNLEDCYRRMWEGSCRPV
jgi:protein O-GlcNAc transferase